MSLFNGLRATPGQFLFLGGPFPPTSVARAGRRRSEGRRRTPRRAEKAWRAENHRGRHRNGPIGHWDQTNAVFAFWQEIVDSARFLQIPGARVAVQPATVIARS